MSSTPTVTSECVVMSFFFFFAYSSPCFTWKGGKFGPLELSVWAVSDYSVRILLLNKYLPYMLKIIIFILDMNQANHAIIITVCLQRFKMMRKVTNDC